MRKRIADNVSAELRRRRYTTTNLPALTGDGSQSSWQRRTSGETSFTAEELLELATVLEVPVDAFFVGVPVSGVTHRYPVLRVVRYEPTQDSPTAQKCITARNLTPDSPTVTTVRRAA